jgi:carboxypeptidase family protein/TonB-dependent receptor-like protein
MRAFCRSIIFIVCALVLHASTAAAQVDRASLTGTVKDSSDAVVPGATVTARNIGTTVPSQAVTDSQGTYVIAGLIPGYYLVEVELSGFNKMSRTVDLETGQRARVDFKLAVGAVEQNVTVEAGSPVVNTEQATLGTVISETEVAKLPLSLRNWDDLLGLAAGVQGDRYTEQAGSTAAGRTGGVNVHGVRSLQNNFLLDGLDNNSISENVQELTTQVSRPSVDSIGEFKVVTSAYSAEFGRSPGASISVTTKSGSNKFQGTAYEYLRNDALNSNDFFSIRQHAPKPDTHAERFRWQPRRSARPRQGVLLRRRRMDPADAGRHPSDRRADGAGAAGNPLDDGQGSAHRKPICDQHDSCRPYRSRLGAADESLPAAECVRREQLFPYGEHDRRLSALSRAVGSSRQCKR